ncbi:MAG: aldehyde dehydrogenase family protein [Pseudomonadota bacterium]
MTKTIQCISPIDWSVYAERACASPEDARAAVMAAKASQKAWAALSISERADYVMRAVAYVGDTQPRMVEELAWQMGRPVRYGGEFGGFNERASYMAEIAEDALADMVIEDSGAFTRKIKREAAGTVLVVAPWNYPYMTAINTIAPALIAGNTVVLKHASQTILVGEHLADAFAHAGLPEGVFTNLVLDHDTTSALIADGLFACVNFTGSVGGGRAMERAAAGTFTAVATELGGKDPGYVRADAGVKAAAEALIDGAMFNSGQCCCGIERLYLHDDVYDDFLDIAREIVEGYVLGNPLDTATTLGPMAQTRFADLVRSQTQEALELGAQALIDPKLFPQDRGAYLMPQILIRADHHMRVMQEESFGPVVGIMRVANDEEAIGLMNDSQFGLTCALWTQDADAAEAIGARLETGMVFMNRCDYLDPALCWTGCKDTGRGAGLSALGYHALTRPKSYHLKKVIS